MLNGPAQSSFSRRSRRISISLGILCAAMVALSVLIAILWLASPFQIGRTTFAVSFITDMLSGGGERRLGPFLFSHSRTVDGAMSTRAFARSEERRVGK